MQKIRRVIQSSCFSPPDEYDALALGFSSRQLALPIVALALAFAVACGSSATVAPGELVGLEPSPTTEQPSPTQALTPSGSGSRTLAVGEFTLPDAGSFGEPGFHEELIAAHNLPQDVGRTVGMTLVIALRDAGRPQQTCSREHPLSGCATVDWSDAESPPKVPPGGVFDNSLTVQLESGTHTVFLSESGGLNDAPDSFDPG